MTFWATVSARLAAGDPACVVTVREAMGSTPREAGARMAVFPDGFIGTIGGGRLEHEALAEAARLLAAGTAVHQRDVPLGPDLGQCCGGRVRLLFDLPDAAEAARLAEAEAAGPFPTATHVGARVVREPFGTGGWTEWHGAPRQPVVICGAGHTGRALMLALAPLPFAVTLADARADQRPSVTPAAVTLAGDPAAALDAAPDDAFAVILTHSHALDLDLTAQALRRRLPYVGLIGSATKRARFVRRLAALGVPTDGLTCPIGVPGIRGKAPAVIALAVAAQLQARAEAQALREAG